MTQPPDDAALVARLRDVAACVGQKFQRDIIAEAATALEAKDRRIAELTEALNDLMSWFPEKPSPPEWRLKGGQYGADEAVEAARAALEPSDKGVG